MRRGFKEAEGGVSAVEFALVHPVFIILIFGAIEFGLIFFTYEAAGHAAWDATRQLATNQITASQASSVALSELPSWVRSSATVTPSSTSTDPTTNHYTVTISIPAKAATPTNILIWAYQNLTLKAQSSMQQEPTS